MHVGKVGEIRLRWSRGNGNREDCKLCVVNINFLVANKSNQVYQTLDTIDIVDKNVNAVWAAVSPALFVQLMYIVHIYWFNFFTLIQIQQSRSKVLERN